MEKELHSYLWEDERVLWRGKPAKFPLLDNGSKIEILSTWILTTAVLGGMLLYFFSRGGWWHMVFLCLLSLCAVLIFVAPIVERQNLQGCKYWITDQRAILMTQDKTFYYMRLSEIDDVRLVRDLSMQDCVVLGSCLFEEIHKHFRWRACHPKLDVQAHENMNQAVGLVFYCVSNAGVAVKLLEQKCGKYTV